MQKRRGFHEEQAGGPASSATAEDLASVVELLRQAEALRAEAAVKLARVRARGDGEAAIGMPVEQHLRWNTNARRGLVSSLGLLTDVAGELPTLMAALESASVNLDQAFAVAWPASRVSREVRRSLDVSLATDAEGWTNLSPEGLQAEVERLLEDLTPTRTEAQELERAQRQFLFTESTLDGQGLRGNFQAWGVDAAYINAKLDTASTTRGLAPRMSAAQVDRLRAEGARTIKVFAVDGEIVAVKGRAGHVINDPGGLSEETTRIICTVRDRTCRMPGCDRPAEHLHHLIWRGLAKARGQVSPDDPRHRAMLCTRCHHQVVHRWRWSGTVGALGRLTWNRGPTTVATVGRLAARLPSPPPKPDLDQFGDPLPF